MNRIASIVLCLLAVCSTTQAADPQELTNLRENYLEALKGVRDPIKAKYIGQMKELLAQHTKDGNLQEALTVREAIREMENEEKKSSTPSNPTTRPSTDSGRPGGRFRRDTDPTAPPAAGTVVLRPEDATLEGALKVYRGYIVYWIRPNCRARWHSRDVPAGKYDIYFVCSAGYGQGGTVEVRDFTYSFDVKIDRSGFGRV